VAPITVHNAQGAASIPPDLGLLRCKAPVKLDAAYTISRYGGFATNPMKEVTPDG
jgi:hypothetical protein